MSDLPSPSSHRYWAFISYSWDDKPQARSVHRRLERFRIPRSVRPLLREEGMPIRRLHPVYRDDEEVAASGVLDDRLRDAIEQSAAMVLLASPSAARSPYVNQEVKHFAERNDIDRLAVVALGDGEHGSPPLPAAISGKDRELLWVDCRRRRQLDRRALVRVAATILGVNFDVLWRRQRRRRRQALAGWFACVFLLATLFGALLWRQEQSANQRTPSRQQATFESFLAAELRETYEGLAPDGIRYKILRADDLNGDGLIDYFVSEETMCGSGGCPLNVYTTISLGNYIVTLSLQGSSVPQTRTGADGMKEIIVVEYHVSREPIYSVYRAGRPTYTLTHYEFCDGVIFEMCEPTIVNPLAYPSHLTVAPNATIRERPTSTARVVTVGAGDTLEPSYISGDVVGVLPSRGWYLVNVWKGSAGFVPAEAILN